MKKFIKLLREALPEAIGALLATAVLSLIGVLSGVIFESTWVAVLAVISVVWLICSYIAFKRGEPRVLRESQFLRRRAYKGPWKYPKYRQWALVGLVFIPLLVLGGFTYKRYVDSRLADKIVILVANFDGPEPQKYRVTEQILKELNRSLSQFGDTLIMPLDEAISEQQGSALARELGKNQHADLVLWGWYGLTGSDVIVVFHIENLTQSIYLPIEATETIEAQAKLAEFDSFMVQQKISGETTALVLFVRGVVRLEAQDYSETIRSMSAALDIGVWDEDLASKKYPLEYRGFAYLIVEEWESAIDDYNRVIEIDPSDAEVYSNRGLAHFKLGDWERAIDDYNRAIETDPQYATAYTNRGALYFSQRNYDQAIADFTRVIEIEPQNDQAFTNRGAAHAELGEYEYAIADYTRAIEINPQFASSYYNRGVDYGRMGIYEQAIADLTHAIEIDPLHSAAYYNRGLAFANMGDYERAFADFARSIEIDAQDANAYFNRGVTYGKQGDYERAIADYTLAIEIDPLHSAAYYNRGLAFADREDFERAIADFSRTIEIDPAFASAYHNLGNAYYFIGSYTQAIFNYTQAIEIDPKAANTYIARGATYVVLNDYDQALADLNHAIEINPNEAGAYFNRGLMYVERGDYGQAIADFLQVLEISDHLDLRRKAEEKLRELDVQP